MKSNILIPAQVRTIRRWANRQSTTPEERTQLLETTIRELCTALGISLRGRLPGGGLTEEIVAVSAATLPPERCARRVINVEPRGEPCTPGENSHRIAWCDCATCAQERASFNEACAREEVSPC